MSVIVPKKMAEKDLILMSYNFVDSKVDLAYSPTGAFGGLPQIGYDDGEFLRTPYVVIPRLAQMENWMVQPNKNTNWFLFWSDGLVQVLWQTLKSMVIGDGAKIKIFEDDDQTELNEEYTDIVEEWAQHPCGSSPDNRDKTLDNFVIPLILVDNLTCGSSAWYKYIGKRGLVLPEEVGELMIKWLDPRSYVPIRHDYYGWFKLIQFPVVQPGLPADRSYFDHSWRPAIRSWRRNLSSTGPALDMPQVDLPSSEFYWFNLFLRPPMSTVASHLISKFLLSFFRDKYVEKATFPFFTVKVPRHYMRDRNEMTFQQKLNRIAHLVSEYRNGDAFAIEGQEYDDEGNDLSLGWEINPIEIKANIDFPAMFRLLDEQIAYGLFMNVSAVSSSGVKGQAVHLGAGGELGANMGGNAKNMRASIIQTLKWIIFDLFKLKKGKKLRLKRISIEFSKIREQDASLFLNTMSTLNSMGALTTNEVRLFADRIGLELDPLPDELTPEGQAAMQIGMGVDGMGGMGGEMPEEDEENTKVPEGILAPPKPDEIRPGYHKHKDVWGDKAHESKTKHRKFKTGVAAV